MAPRNDLDRQELVRLFCNESLPLHVIASHFKCSRQHIAKKISDYGLLRNYENPKWLEEQHYVNSLGFDQMAELTNCSYESIRINMAKYGFKALYEIRYRGVKKYVHNEKYFDDINTPEKAYWLGFILADGCISKEACNTYRMVIQLQRRDRGHLQKLLDHLESNAPIKDGSAMRNETPTLWSKIRINSSYLCGALMELGITPKKSLKEKVPPIGEKFYKDFIRGVFDGDGCFYTRSPYSAVFSLVGSLEVMSFIASILQTKCARSVNCSLAKGSMYTTVVHSCEDVLAIMHWLYRGSTVHLDRKYEHYTHWLDSRLSPEDRVKELKIICAKGRKATIFGENHCLSKLTDEKARKILSLYQSGNYLYRDLAEMFSVSLTTIAQVVKGISWNKATDLPYVNRKYMI